MEQLIKLTPYIIAIGGLARTLYWIIKLSYKLVQVTRDVKKRMKKPPYLCQDKGGRLKNKS